GYRHECAYILAKGRPALPQKPLPDVLGWKYSGNRHHPTEKPVSDADYDVRLVQDCCYDPDRDAHEALLRSGFGGRVQVV
ncbi:hypothetical protein JFA18_004723, partial [Salmonella enterica subsp. enterica serovar Brandenburg]|nr:hypothetical protein [Salmonella enterica subsp. enterica serovar Brandenburg]